MSHKTKTLLFHNALAPYRVDLFNELGQYLDLTVVFLWENLVEQKFDQDRLKNALTVKHDYLCTGFDVGTRAFRWGVGRMISRDTPSVVVCPEFSPTTLSAVMSKRMAFRRKWGLIIWNTDTFEICNGMNLSRRLARTIALSATDGLVVYTPRVKHWFIQNGFPEDAIGIFPNMQSENHFRNSLTKAVPVAKRLLKEYSLIGKQIILFVGRLDKIKGIDRIIHAFEGIQRHYPKAILLIVGAGPERRPLEHLVETRRLNEKVRFVGRFEGSNLLAWYHIGQVLVLASRSEKYGAVVNEALLAGMPVICSTRAGAAELIRGGRNGSTFNPYDIAALQNHLETTLDEIKPLEPADIYVRDSLMPVSFGAAVQEFVNVVEYTAAKARA